ncbi:SH3 domain-binding glutamic acid-rich-like protein 3 [Dunckerocampus dactyliophorus]|uniref:SH3 domain-binding glutamic acid-rich-like protein 3 n=1 Tax=Dunckerocampus dactyliophorus TaxID=161453 RepID=UPI0024069D31|nr:SH3 domain-binding glutamic acid-rich-like protein 3 [Dunckerocampus dactyliophorus]
MCVHVCVRQHATTSQISGRVPALRYVPSKPAYLVYLLSQAAQHTLVPAAMSVIVYYSSVSSNLVMKKQQSRVFDVLESKNISFEQVDIAQDAADKELMRSRANNPTALPPQICNGDVYCGDYEAFESAVEDGQLEAFLKL